jgi:hypothetical protein
MYSKCETQGSPVTRKMQWLELLFPAHVQTFLQCPSCLTELLKAQNAESTKSSNICHHKFSWNELLFYSLWTAYLVCWSKVIRIYGLLHQQVQATWRNTVYTKLAPTSDTYYGILSEIFPWLVKRLLASQENFITYGLLFSVPKNFQLKINSEYGRHWYEVQREFIQKTCGEYSDVWSVFLFIFSIEIISFTFIYLFRIVTHPHPINTHTGSIYETLWSIMNIKTSFMSKTLTPKLFTYGASFQNMFWGKLIYFIPFRTTYCGWISSLNSSLCLCLRNC